MPSFNSEAFNSGIAFVIGRHFLVLRWTIVTRQEFVGPSFPFITRKACRLCCHVVAFKESTIWLPWAVGMLQTFQPACCSSASILTLACCSGVMPLLLLAILGLVWGVTAQEVSTNPKFSRFTFRESSWKVSTFTSSPNEAPPRRPVQWQGDFYYINGI